jgi:sec-independent protein translocase protein TatB
MGTPPPIEMANLGMWDSLILMIMALVVFGPRRLPEIGRQIGKLMYEFRKASNDFKFQMEEELRTAEEADRRKKEEERQLALAPPAAAPLTLEGGMADAASPPAADSESVQTVAAVAEAAAEEGYPRIMPPSTGEQVAASRPNSMAALAQAASEAGEAAEQQPVEETADATDTPHDTEQAAHHA